MSRPSEGPSTRSSTPPTPAGGRTPPSTLLDSKRESARRAGKPRQHARCRYAEATGRMPGEIRGRGREHHDHRQPHGRLDRGPDRQRRCRRRRVAQAAARRLVLRPGVHDDRGVCSSAITDLDGDDRHPALPRLPDRAARRAVDLPRGRLPAHPRRAADRRSSSSSGARHHVPHVHPREHAQAVHGGLPLRRPPDGHARVGGRRAVDLLSRGQGHRRRRSPRQADRAPHRQDADARRLLRTASASACRSSIPTTRSTSPRTSSR